jgi:molybdopterin converting factor small subunit
MIKVKFYSLLRSNYGIEEDFFDAGSINEIINQIIIKYPEIKPSAFRYSVVFYQGKPIHYHGFETKITDGEEIIFTQFVGGG